MLINVEFYKKIHYIGWINASDLLANDSILIYNGKANVIGKEVEELNAEETTYNFEVEDYHTYYVGVNNILVHNSCSNIDNCCDSKTVIHGEAHGSNIHKNRINDKVKEILNCNEYSDIY